MSENAGSVRITRLIFVPLVITLAITLLWLEGELHHGSGLLLSRGAGGAGAIVGIAWLPFIFGPYFAARLTAAGAAPSSSGKVIVYALIGLVVTILAVAMETSPGALNARALAGLLLIAAAGMIQFMSWETLARTLLAYGFGARVPVAIVMFYALAGDWGTHYDALPPGYAGPTDFMGRYIAIGLVPQFIFRIAYTMIIGALAAGVYLAIARRGRGVVPQAA